MNIRHKLIAAFLLVVLVPLTLNNFVHDGKIAEAILKGYENKDSARLELFIDELHKLEKSAENYIHFLAQDPNLIQTSYYATNLDTPAGLETLLPQMRAQLGLSYIEVLNEENQVVYAAYDPALGNNRHTHSATDDHEIMTNRSARFEYDADLGNYEITTSAAIVRMDKTIAYVNGGYVLEETLLKRLSTDVTISLYHPDTQTLITAEPGDIDQAWLKSVADAWRQNCTGSTDKTCLNESHRIARIEIHGEQHLLIAAPLFSSQKQFLGIVSASEAALLMNEELAQSRRFVIILTLAAIAAAALIGWLQAGTFSRPIESLKLAAIRLGKGDLSTRANIHSDDEFGVLAMTFNQMAEDLSVTTFSKEYVENILRSMADVLIVTSTDGSISRVNQAAITLLGCDEKELAGLNINEILTDYNFMTQVAKQLALDGNFRNWESALLTREGDRIDVQLSGAHIYSPHQLVLGTVYVAQDIRERKRAEHMLAQKNAELAHSLKELDQFAYVVSHDLKAPLRGISNLAEWIEEDLAEAITDDAREQMKLLKGRVQRMENLINGILEYSRIGRVDTNIERIDSGSLIKEIIETMPVPPGYTIQVDEAMPTLDAPKVQLGQVFANLISNAIKYRKDDHGRVDISVNEENDFYRFSVKDDGPGIAPQFHEKVFMIFQTLNARDKVESTGVGLTLVKKIVEEHGGTVALASEEGEGATFSFTWPKKLSKKGTT